MIPAAHAGATRWGNGTRQRGDARRATGDTGSSARLSRRVDDDDVEGLHVSTECPAHPRHQHTDERRDGHVSSLTPLPSGGVGLGRSFFFFFFKKLPRATRQARHVTPPQARGMDRTGRVIAQKEFLQLGARGRGRGSSHVLEPLRSAVVPLVERHLSGVVQQGRQDACTVSHAVSPHTQLAFEMDVPLLREGQEGHEAPNVEVGRRVALHAPARLALRPLPLSLSDHAPESWRWDGLSQLMTNNPASCPGARSRPGQPTSVNA